MASSPEIPATSEVLLKSDASKQFLDSLLGQGWDAWGQGLGGSQAAELMLEMFSAFNIVALATISALFLWVLAVSVAGSPRPHGFRAVKTGPNSWPCKHSAMPPPAFICTSLPRLQPEARMIPGPGLHRPLLLLQQRPSTRLMIPWPRPASFFRTLSSSTWRSSRIAKWPGHWLTCALLFRKP